ncbi:MAG: type II toxin-antitoxin system VapC family toxin [Pirellulales bacterium]|nr:type II toxin-antitoxin system VapC family toxin [Pirellulales bacterium]
MATFFLDSSAIAKRYVTEVGTGWTIALTDPGSYNVCWLAAVTRVEVITALYRRHRMGHIGVADTQRAAAAFLHEVAVAFRVLTLDSAMLDAAARLIGVHPILAYDAIQLATALRLGSEYDSARLPPPVFVCADQTLNHAAAAEGLMVENPTAHP